MHIGGVVRIDRDAVTSSDNLCPRDATHALPSTNCIASPRTSKKYRRVERVSIGVANRKSVPVGSIDCVTNECDAN